MCFHISIAAPIDQIEQELTGTFSSSKNKHFSHLPAYHLNGFAHPVLPVLYQEFPEQILPAYWGIAPQNTTLASLADYYKQSVRFGGGLNAKSERLFDHFIYQKCILQRRCVIPVTGFFEPHKPKDKSYPVFIQSTKHRWLFLAGIYNKHAQFISVSIITKPATRILKKVHFPKERQALILSSEEASNWLSDLQKTDIDALLRTEKTNAELEAYTVSDALFKPNEESNIPSILEPKTFEELGLVYF